MGTSYCIVKMKKSKLENFFFWLTKDLLILANITTANFKVSNSSWFSIGKAYYRQLLLVKVSSNQLFYTAAIAMFQKFEIDSVIKEKY